MLIMGGAMKTAKLFKNGQSQAVRLPKELKIFGLKQADINPVLFKQIEHLH